MSHFSAVCWKPEYCKHNINIEIRLDILEIIFTKPHHIILFAVHFAVHIVKRFAAQRPATGAADEAIGVIEIAHCLASLAGTGHLVTASVADAKIFALLFVAFHFLFQLPGKLLDFALCRCRTGWTRRRYVVRQQRFGQLLIFF